MACWQRASACWAGCMTGALCSRLLAGDSGAHFSFVLSFFCLLRIVQWYAQQGRRCLDHGHRRRLDRHYHLPYRHKVKSVCSIVFERAFILIIRLSVLFSRKLVLVLLSASIKNGDLGVRHLCRLRMRLCLWHNKCRRGPAF